MFALVVHEENRPPWRKVFAAKREVRIGSADENEVVIAGADKRHARLVLKDTKYILVDLKSDTGTWVNGRRMTSPLVVKDRDKIVLANARIDLVPLAYEKLATPLVARDRKEADLIAAIESGEAGARTVYADWLEERGDHARAEVLRLQDANTDEDRVRELVANLDLPWRARVTELPIENCISFAFKCPKKWSALAPTSVDGERFCTACSRTVYYTATIDDARDHAALGHCVAIDLASPRWNGDLAPPFKEYVCSECDFDVGEGIRYCPRCDKEIVVEEMMMGEIA